MRIIKPYFIIEDEINGEEMLKKLERAGRTCYKSEEKITKDTLEQGLKALLEGKPIGYIESRFFTNHQS